jgi:beta-N-acetylhexosaminidase
LPGIAALSRGLTGVLLGAIGILGLVAEPPPELRQAPPAATSRLPDDDLTRQIGQMLMVGFAGQATSHASVRRTLDQLRRGQIGGVLLFGRNVKSRRQVAELTRELRAAAGTLPPLIAIDQEGGKIQRMGPEQGFAQYPSAAGVAGSLDAEGAQRLYRGLAGELKDVGINLNLGPVVDLDRNRGNRVIGGHGRSYGPDPDRVTTYARAFIAAHRAVGVLTAAKHFPGHGSSRGDSHHGFVDIGETWSPAELEPYRALAGRDGPSMVMVGHLHLPALGEGSALPATLSKRAIIDTLRNRLGFEGVVITDDLEMGAIRDHYRFEESIIAAVNAGNDILLFGNLRDDPRLVERVVMTIRRAVLSGTIAKSRIEEASRRVVALRRSLSVAAGATAIGMAH